MKLRPMNDWILVEIDPLPTQIGSILIPQGINIRTATILRVGPGVWKGNVRVPTGLEPGDKVAYFRWHEEHQNGKRIGAALKELGDNHALVRVPDLLFTWPRGIEVQVTT